MLVAMRNPPLGPQSRGVDAVNISLAHGTEFSRFTTFFLSSTFPPNGFNWANWKNPEFDALIDQIEKSSDPEEIASDIRRAHEVIVDDAAWLFIVHDLNPRAMTNGALGARHTDAPYLKICPTQDIHGVFIEGRTISSKSVLPSYLEAG
jgi:peptide/nickel transport system substrate-binding protein